MIQWLIVLTTLVNLLSMAGSLWLGCYLVTRSPRSRLAWLAALTLWSLASLFVRNILVIHLPGSELVYRLRLAGLFGLASWFHLTVLLPPERTDRLARLLSYWFIRMGLVGLAYGLAFLIFLYHFLFPGPTPAPDVLPIYIAGRATGSANPYAIVHLLLVGPLAVLNLWQGWVQARHTRQRRILTAMLMVTIPALLGGLYLLLGSWLHPRLPVLPGDALLGAAMLLLGYNVARYHALIEGRTIERDVLYATVGIGLAMAFYGLVVLVLHMSGHASVLTLVLILVCVILSHALYDGGRTTLDRLFYHGQFRQLRANLRVLAREAGTAQEIPDQLQVTLDALCRALHIRRGFIALRQEDVFVVEAAEGIDLVGHTFPLPPLVATEIVALPRPGTAYPQDMALLVPLFASGVQIGALVLGTKASHQPYNEEDLELLDDLADQMATVIHVWRLQEENAEMINEMVAAFHDRERALQRQMQQMTAQGAGEAWPVLGGIGEEAFVALVEECLRRLHDFSYLGEHTLAGLQAVTARLNHRSNDPITHIDRGKALNQVLLLALDKLRPAGAEPQGQEVPSREWHQYIILHDAYVRNTLTREIMSRLYISEPTFHRTRRRAVRSVAKALREMEQAVVK